MHLKILFLLLTLGMLPSKTVYAQFCSIDGFTTNPSLCLPSPNSGGYEVSGTITTSNPPTTGSLVIRTGLFSGTILATFPLSAGTTIHYTLPVQTGNGGNITLHAYYTAYSILCSKSSAYTPPRCCDVHASSPVTVCESQTLTLNATSTTGGSYFWSGPGSFSSTQQNPVIHNVSTSAAGSYQVYLVNGRCTTAPVTVNANINTKPVSKNITHW